MTPEQAKGILSVVACAYDRDVPAGLAEIWAAALADIDHELGRTAAFEFIKTSPHLPRVSEIRDRAKLLTAEVDRASVRRRQLDARREQAAHSRDAAGLWRLVLAALADAGQDVAAGKLLGAARCAEITDAVVADWLAQTPDPGA
jgi:hypothetical protein